MRATIASGIGSLLAVMASHSGRCTTSRADALPHFSTRIQTGLRTDSGEERKDQSVGNTDTSFGTIVIGLTMVRSTFLLLVFALAAFGCASIERPQRSVEDLI